MAAWRDGALRVRTQGGRRPDGVRKAGTAWRRLAVVQTRPAPLQRTTPHPALRATFPSKLGKGSPCDLRCVNTVAPLRRHARRGHPDRPAQQRALDHGNAGGRQAGHLWRSHHPDAVGLWTRRAGDELTRAGRCAMKSLGNLICVVWTGDRMDQRSGACDSDPASQPA
jgi:hypothetical protein